MGDVVIKRRLAEATQRIVKMRDPDIEGIGLVCAALGDLLGEWTGQKVRVLITANGQSQAVDMQKYPTPGASHD